MGKEEGFAPGKHTLIFPSLSCSVLVSLSLEPAIIHCETAASSRVFASEDAQ